MKRNLVGVFSILLALALTAGLVLAHGAQGKEVALKGEIIDLQCYLVHPDNSQGESHAKCAEACINKGLGAGLLTEKGELYVLLGPGHDSAKDAVAKYAGKTVTVKGVAMEQNGIKALQIKSVTE